MSKKLKTFRLSETSIALLERAKRNHIKISKFVRESISEKFERDFSEWVEEEKTKHKIELPF